MLRSRKQWLAMMVVLMSLNLPLDELQVVLSAEENEPPSSKDQMAELTEKINRWVRELDDDSFQVREKAEANLVKVGLPAWEAVLQASQSSSIEVRTRARRVLAKYRELKKNLQFLDSIALPELRYVVSATVSADGKFVYAAAWRGNAVSVFSRDAKSGHLEHLQTINDQENLLGAVSLRLSPNGRYALATAFQSQTAVLFQRDEKSGRLTVSDVARQGQNNVDGLRWAIDNVFSPDSQFVYVVDPRGTGAQRPTVDGEPGAVTAFRITKEGKLQWIEANRGQDECFNGARGIALHPNGKTLFVTSSGQGALVVLSRDADSGKTRVRQILRDGQMGVQGLEGVSSVDCSPDGRFVYTSSGRFHGDNAIGVYRLSEEGRLSVVQEIINGEGELEKFEGGNEIRVSPDGRNVFAAATRSEAIAAFQRDAKTGRLTSPEVTQFSSLGPPGSGLGPAGVGISPDGKHVYVALESSGAIAIFQRQMAPATKQE